MRTLAGRPWDPACKLPCGALHSSADASVGSTAGSTGGALPFSRAFPQNTEPKWEQVGGTSTASPEIILNGKRRECLQQGLFGEDGQFLNVCLFNSNPQKPCLHAPAFAH